MIKVYNRKTGCYETEPVAWEGFLNIQYNTFAGRCGLELLFKRKLYSSLFGKLCDSRFSASKIKGFVERHGIDMSECADGIRDFKSFNDFFTRRLKPEARKFAADPALLLSPGDGRVRVWKDIDMKYVLQVKGFSYTLEELLADREMARKYHGGICMVVRLAPVDYHRFHFIDGGRCSGSKSIKGACYSVNPIALNTIPGLFCRNRRAVSMLRSAHFGDIAYVEIGATFVGSIIQTYKPDTVIGRGDEKGYFKLGGSTVLLFLEKDTAAIDEDILLQTEMGYEVKVSAGETVGHRP